MNVIDQIRDLFVKGASSELHTEDVTSVEYSCEASETQTVSKEQIDLAVNLISERDTLSIFITIGESDAIIYSSSENNYTDFDRELRTQINLKEDEDSIIFKVRINKRRVDNQISIYNTNTFEDYLGTLTLEQALITFSDLLENGPVVFSCFDAHKLSQTNSIYFVPNGSSIVPTDNNFRIKRLETIYTTVHFSFASKCKLIAEDFMFVNDVGVPKKLSKLFKNLSFALLLISIFDITEINLNRVTFKLNGYKTIHGEFSYEQNDDYDQYKKIYEWIYSSGKLLDKIGLSRNLISLHLEAGGKVALKGDAFQSILSGYKIYEKENIKQYIEIRNKISEQLLDFNKRATQIVDTFAGNYQKTSLAIITFFSSLVVIRFLNSNQISLSFTVNAVILSSVFIIVSIIYLIISYNEILSQKERFSNSYKNMKERYTDLLTWDDIKRILNGDKEFTSDVSFIETKIRTYTTLWVITIILVFISAISLFGSGVYEFINKIIPLIIPQA